MSKTDSLGMELDHTEEYLSTEVDDKKVKDVVKSFDGDNIMKEMSKFMEERKKRIADREQNRKVKEVGGLFGLSKEPDTTAYYTSYDDHLKKLDIEIEDQKASLVQGLERLKLLIEKEVLIREERDAVTAETFQLPEYLKTNERLDPIVKEHIFRKHPLLIGDYYGEHKYSSHAGHLNLERVYDKDGNIVKLRCWNCLREFYRTAGPYDAPTKNDGEIDLHDHLGEK